MGMLPSQVFVISEQNTIDYFNSGAGCLSDYELTMDPNNPMIWTGTFYYQMIFHIHMLLTVSLMSYIIYTAHA